MISGCILSALAGMLISALFSLLPGVNMIFISSLIISYAGNIAVSDPNYSFCFAAGAVTAYLFFSLIPAVLLSAPDDSSVFISRYSGWMLTRGRGREAVLVSALGTLIGVLIACGSAVFFMDRISIAAEQVQEHSWWIGCSALFLLQCSLRFADIPAGSGVIVLSGVLGLAVFDADVNKYGIPGIYCFPVIAGLFSAPSLLLNPAFGWGMPEQGKGLGDIPLKTVVASSIYGTLFGTFQALFPIDAAGAGPLLADRTSACGHRAKLVTMGVLRPVYCLGVLFLAFNFGIPSLPVAGQISVLKGEPLYLGGACVMLSAAMSVILLNLVFEKGKLFSGSLTTGRVRRICLFGLLLLAVTTSGLSGLAIFIVSTAVGMIPPLFGLSRIYCISALIVPVL